MFNQTLQRSKLEFMNNLLVKNIIISSTQFTKSAKNFNPSFFLLKPFTS